MQHFKQLFYFLNSNTPSEVEWLNNYIRKQGYNSYRFTQIEGVIEYLANSDLPKNSKDWPTFADKMKKAYRTRQTRKGENRKKMLNVTIAPQLLMHLDSERKRLKLSRSKLMEKILDGTIYDLLNLQKQKHIDNQERKNAREDKRISMLDEKIQKKESKINELTCEVDRLHNSLEKAQETLNHFFTTIKNRTILYDEYDIQEICQLQTLYLDAMQTNIKQT